MSTLVQVGLANALAAAVLAVIVAPIAWLLLKARRPALAHGLWLLVLLRLLAPPVFELPVGLPGRDVADLSPTPTRRPLPVTVSEGRPLQGTMVPSGLKILEVPGPEPLDDATAPAPPQPRGTEPVAEPPASRPAWNLPGLPELFGLAWLAGALGWLGLAIVRVRRFGWLLREAGPAPEEVVDRVRALARLIGLRRVPAVVLVPGVVSPMVWALYGRARLAIPTGLWDRLDDDGRDALVLHELAHLRRGDPWVRRLELLATAFYWWHPALWLARHALHEAEEQCCDAWVVWARPEAARTYAEALVEAVDFLSNARPRALPAGASGMGRVRNLSRRIVMIMKGRTPRRLSWLGLILLVALGALLLPWIPIGARSATQQQLAAAQAEHRALDAAIIRQRADEIELLESQVAIKQAGVVRASATRNLAHGRNARLRQLHRQGTVGDEEVAEAGAAIQLAEADLSLAEAELRQAELKVKQARRRLADETPITPATTEPVPPATPAGGDRPQGARLQTRMNNLKRVGLALHNYHSAYNRLPAAAIMREDGTPLLSWRVAVLPYVDDEGATLFQRFRLDEPWDSPHNKALLAEMPSIYATEPGDGSGQTRLVAPFGPSTFWSNLNGTGFEEILDGLSNTLAVVESPRPVPWTKPDELPYPVDSETLKRLYDDGFLGLFGDGSVRTFRPRHPAFFHALFTRAGGEVIDSGTLDTPSGEDRIDYAPPVGAPTDRAGMMGGGSMMAAGSGMGPYGGMTAAPGMGGDGGVEMSGMMGGMAAMGEAGMGAMGPGMMGGGRAALGEAMMGMGMGMAPAEPGGVEGMMMGATGGMRPGMMMGMAPSEAPLDPAGQIDQLKGQIASLEGQLARLNRQFERAVLDREAAAFDDLRDRLAAGGQGAEQVAQAVVEAVFDDPPTEEQKKILTEAFAPADNRAEAVSAVIRRALQLRKPKGGFQ